MFISRTDEIGSWSHTQATMSIQRQVANPSNVVLPHQQLYGVMPLVSPHAKEMITKNVLAASGHLTTLTDDWDNWKPFLKGVQLHSFNDELLDKVLSSEINSVKQVSMLKELHDHSISAIELQLNECKSFFVDKLNRLGFSMDADIADFMKNTVELEIESSFFEKAVYPRYNPSNPYLKFSFSHGLSVLDIDLIDKPKPLKDLAVNLIRVLAAIGNYNTSLDLIYTYNVDQEVMDYLLSLDDESRKAIKVAVNDLDEEELTEFVVTHHSELAEEHRLIYGDIETLLYSLSDCVEFNFEIQRDGTFQDIFHYDDLEVSIKNIMAVLQYWCDSQNPLSSHPLANKLTALCDVLLSHCKFELINHFETCSDADVSSFRVISFDLVNDEAALNNINQYINDTCENGELEVDLTDSNCIAALKQMRMADVLIGILVSS